MEFPLPHEARARRRGRNTSWPWKRLSCDLAARAGCYESARTWARELCLIMEGAYVHAPGHRRQAEHLKLPGGLRNWSSPAHLPENRLWTAQTRGGRLMIDTFKELIINQYDATLCTLGACVTRCPDASWNAPRCSATSSVRGRPFIRYSLQISIWARRRVFSPASVSSRTGRGLSRTTKRTKIACRYCSTTNPGLRSICNTVGRRAREVVRSATAESFSSPADLHAKSSPVPSCTSIISATSNTMQPS